MGKKLIALCFTLISIIFVINVEALSYGRITSSSATTRVNIGTNYAKTVISKMEMAMVILLFGSKYSSIQKLKAKTLF